jgi:hypothetical protein
MEPNATMKVYLAAGLAAALVAFSSGHGQAQSTSIGATRKETTVKARATGTFDVKVTPLPADEHASTGEFARLSLDKQYRGAVEGTSRGQMLAADTAVKGSGAYVALERVSGTLNGRTGSFILQHNGTMAGGAYDLKVTVVPDSGTDELVGLSGTLKIIIEGGKHSYEFDYTQIDRPVR